MLRKAVGIFEESHTYTGPKCKKTVRERKLYNKPNPNYKGYMKPGGSLMSRLNKKTGCLERRV